MFLDLITYPKLLFLCAATFGAGFVDSVAGGGGVLSIPAYLLTGLDPKVAFACNKTSSCIGTTLAALRFIKNGSVNWFAALPAAVAALAGARIASVLVLSLDSAVFQKIILLFLPFVAAFMIFKRDFGEAAGAEALPAGRVAAISALIGLVLAFYDGLVGPGTGTFAIIAFSSILKIDLRSSSGSAKVFNWASNLASTVSFVLAGKVIWALVAITAVCSMAGNYLGAGMAIKRDMGFIRVMLSAVCGILMLKLAADFFM